MEKNAKTTQPESISEIMEIAKKLELNAGPEVSNGYLKAMETTINSLFESELKRISGTITESISKLIPAIPGIENVSFRITFQNDSWVVQTGNRKSGGTHNKRRLPDFPAIIKNDGSIEMVFESFASFARALGLKDETKSVNDRITLETHKIPFRALWENEIPDQFKGQLIRIPKEGHPIPKLQKRFGIKTTTAA